jgi:hypothetical protein
MKKLKSAGSARDLKGDIRRSTPGTEFLPTHESRRAAKGHQALAACDRCVGDSIVRSCRIAQERGAKAIYPAMLE